MTEVESVESIGPVENGITVWEGAVRDKARNQCSNCGSGDRLRVQLIVPIPAGGRYIVSNGVLLCRTCDMARQSVPVSGPQSNRWPINLWISRALHDRIQDVIKTKNGFRSMSSMARFLIDRYVSDEGLFDDLEQYQDAGNDVKINLWVDKDTYEIFHSKLKRRGVTVTDAVKALIRMYDSGAGAVVNGRKQ